MINKKLIFAYIALCYLNTVAIKAFSPNFNKSIQEEFDEVVAYQLTCMPEKTEEEVREEMLSFSTGITQKDNVIKLQDLHTCVLQDLNNSALAEQIQDIQEVFNVLKQRMAIPDQVEIWFLRDNAENALYNIFDRKVYISPRFFGDSPSLRLFKLIHELTHCQQHMHDGLMGMAIAIGDDRKSAILEHQADTQAAQVITCPICMQIIEDGHSNNKDRVKLGYLTKIDIATYKLTKQGQDLCSAHKLDSLDNQRLKTLLPVVTDSLNIFQKAVVWWQADKKSQERMELDFKISSIKDRLSSVKFDK